MNTDEILERFGLPELPESGEPAECTATLVIYRFQKPNIPLISGVSLPDAREYSNREDAHGDEWFVGYRKDLPLITSAHLLGVRSYEWSNPQTERKKNDALHLPRRGSIGLDHHRWCPDDHSHLMASPSHVNRIERITMETYTIETARREVAESLTRYRNAAFTIGTHLPQAARRGILPYPYMVALDWQALREMTREDATFPDRCKVPMVHPDKTESRCILHWDHQRDDSDHIDIHGHRATVLVHQSTIREARAVREARERGEIQ